MSGRAEPAVAVLEEGSRSAVTVGNPVVPVAAQNVTSQLTSAAPTPEAHLRKVLMQGASNAALNAAETSRLADEKQRQERLQEAARLTASDRARTQAAAQTPPLPESPELQSTKPQKRTWYEWCCSVASSVGSVVDTIGKAAIGALKLAGHGIAACYEIAKHVVTDPVAAASSVWGAVKAVASFGYSVGSFLINSALALGSWCINNPGKILPAIGSFLWSAGEMVYSLAASLVSTAYNGIKKVLKGEMSIGEALLNTFVFCCEISGLADVCRLIKHGTLALAAYATGDKVAMYNHLAQAALAGAFVVVALATVGTGGIAAPVLVPLMAVRALVGVALKQGVKQGLKACAREFLECGARKTSEAAIKKMGEPAAKKLAAEAPQEMAKITAMAEKAVGAGASPQVLTAKVNELALERVIQLEGKSIATTMGKTMGDQIATQGAEVLTRQHVKQLGEEVSYAQTKNLLKELGLTQHVDDLTYDMIVSFREMSPKQARAHLMETMGITGKQADKMAKEVQRLIKSGKSDDAIKEVLEKQITADISKFVADKMETSFKETFKKGLRGELTDPENAAWSTKLHQEISKRADDLAKDPKTNPHGKSAREIADDLTDDLVEGAWEGVESGIKKAARELIREGIEQAFKRIRARRMPHASLNRDEDTTETADKKDSEEPQVEDSKIGGALANQQESLPKTTSYQQPEIRLTEVERLDGRRVRLLRKYDESERLLGQEEEVIADPYRQRRAKADKDDYGSAA
jgi:hypothetical protein